MVLIDTNFVVAVYDRDDVNHTKARVAMQTLVGVRIIPAPVLVEAFYMVKERVDYRAAQNMFNRIRTGAFQIEALTDDDMAQMETIMRQYSANEFDYTDTAIMAVAERLSISTIYTFDRRDFTVYKPKYRGYFELLP